MEGIDIEESYISRLRSIDKFVDTVVLKYTHQLRKLITNNIQYASSSQKRALSTTIISIVNILKSQTYIVQSIQLLLYFLPFRPNIAVKRKANHCFQWLAFFCVGFVRLVTISQAIDKLNLSHLMQAFEGLEV